MEERAARLERAVTWLLDANVQDRDVATKRAYLLEKGLGTNEIDTAFRVAAQRSNAVDRGDSGPTPAEEEAQAIAHEKEMDGLRAQIIEALTRVKALQGNPDGPAHVWHSRRRAELVKIPGIRALLRNCNAGQPKELFGNIGLLFAIVIAHAWIARELSRLAATSSIWWTSFMVLLSSVSVGAFFAFNLQALNHELGHGSPQVHLPGADSKLFRTVVNVACYGFGSVGAALCHVPWASYYMGGGHMRHHKFVGAARDVDEDALFVLYQPRFPGVVKRLAWLSVASVLVPVWMYISLVMCAMFDWRKNVKELSLFSLDLILSAIAHYHFGRAGAAYFLISSWCSMGFLCHPLVGFWILQHLCVSGGQPTTSYSGWRIWNLLNLNLLSHVEHHDLAGVPWRHLPRLRELAPDLYDSLHTEASILSLILAWASAGSPGGDKRFAWDFACRTTWGYTRHDAAAQNQAHYTAMKLTARHNAARVAQQGRILGTARPSLSNGVRQRRPPVAARTEVCAQSTRTHGTVQEVATDDSDRGVTSAAKEIENLNLMQDAATTGGTAAPKTPLLPNMQGGATTGCQNIMVPIPQVIHGGDEPLESDNDEDIVPESKEKSMRLI